MPPAESASPSSDGQPSRERDAFRDLHGRRLHGFALLLTLGDRQQAARLTADALADGCRRLASLRHPERAAAWLRARVRARVGRSHAPGASAATVLADLGVSFATLAGLAALDPRTRAAIVARTIEGLDLRDVATVADRDGRRLERMIERGLHRYTEAAIAARDTLPTVPGPITQRLDEVVRRAIR